MITDFQSPFGNEFETPMELSAFISKPVTSNTNFFLGSSVGILQGYGNAAWRVFMGIRTTINPHKKPQKTSLDEQTLQKIDKLLQSESQYQSERHINYFENKNIHFEQNQKDFIPESILLLREYASFLKKQTEIHIRIIGHTDSQGTTRYNQDLSLVRAQKVKRFFVIQGIDPDRMTVEAKGEEQPLYQEQTHYDQLLNRRVEIIFVSNNS